MPIAKKIDETIAMLKKRLRAEESFDLIYRTMTIGGKGACLFFIDGLVKDEVMEKIMEFFYSAKPEDVTDAHSFVKSSVPYIEVALSDDEGLICTNILSGILVLVVDGFDKAISIDVRTYPQRDSSEPDRDKVIVGSRDGFVETLVANTALIRRRIRNPSLTMKILSVGSLSKTDVVLCYMDDHVDHALLNKLLHRTRWYNPFPKFKYTERPDTAAASVLEGNIVILVDNSPSAVIVPTSIFDIIEEADDYYFPPITGTYLRLSRYLISLFTLVVTPLWLLALQNPQWVPELFQFTVQIEEPVYIPIFWQLILLEIAIDGLRLASLNTPSSLTTALSVIAGIVLSDFAVKSGWFNMQSLLYMAFVSIANYSQPSYELGYALKFLRVLLLVLTLLFNLWGFLAGLVLIFILMILNKTISGKSYLYPLIPFNGKELKKKLIRTRLHVKY